MPRPKKTQQNLERRIVSGAWLAEVVGVSDQWINALAREGKIPKEEDGFVQEPVLRALFRIFREQATNTSARTKEHAERTAAAEATSAEVRAAKDLGAACLAGEIEAQWEDVATQVRIIVETFSGLTEAQKNGLLEKLTGVKLAESEGA